MKKIVLVLILFLFPAAVFAGEYVLIKGKGVEMCEAYGKNVNSMHPPKSLVMPYEQILNPEFKDFSKPAWEATFSQELFDKINLFLWERDVNPIYRFPVTEYKNWRGTPEQYALAWEHYKGNRQKTLSLGLPVSKVDIDNDGKTENIAYDSVNNRILMVLNDDKTEIDLKKTALVLQHPSRKAEGKGELTADGRRISDAMHSVAYDVFIYKQKTYFDLYIDLRYIFVEKESMIWGKLQPKEKFMKRKETEPDGILRIFITENQNTQEICTYQFKISNNK